jgi:hypothetical protein
MGRSGGRQQVECEKDVAAVRIFDILLRISGIGGHFQDFMTSVG